MENDFLNKSEDEFEDEDIRWPLIKRCTHNMKDLFEFCEDVPFRKRFEIYLPAIDIKADYDDEEYKEVAVEQETVFPTQEKKINKLRSEDIKPWKKDATNPSQDYLDQLINLNAPDKPLVCIHCSKLFETHMDFALHSECHNENNIYSCHQCDFREQSQTKFKNHILSHDQYLCKQCNIYFKTKSYAYKHYKTHEVHEMVPCDICSKPVRIDYMFVHKKSVHGSVSMHQCTVCDKSYKGITALRSHISSQHKELGVDLSIICDICGKRLSNKGSLKFHVRRHKGDKPFACTECPKTFPRSSQLKQHLRVHTGEKPYSCMYCDKKFAHSSPYYYHLKTHTGERPYSCRFCGKGFISRRNMQIHLNTCKRPVE